MSAIGLLLMLRGAIDRVVVANYTSIDGRPILDLFPSFRLLFFRREHSPRLASLPRGRQEKKTTDPKRKKEHILPRLVHSQKRTRVSCPRLDWASLFLCARVSECVLCACNPIVLAQIVTCLGRPPSFMLLSIITRRSLLLPFPFFLCLFSIIGSRPS